MLENWVGKGVHICVTSPSMAREDEYVQQRLKTVKSLVLEARELVKSYTPMENMDSRQTGI